MVETESTLILTAAQYFAGEDNTKIISGDGQVVITEIASDQDSADLGDIKTNLTIDLGTTAVTELQNSQISVADGKILTVTSADNNNSQTRLDVTTAMTFEIGAGSSVALENVNTGLALMAAQATGHSITGAGQVFITDLDDTPDAALADIDTNLTIDLGTTDVTELTSSQISVADGKILTVTSDDNNNSQTRLLDVTSAKMFDIGAGSSVALENVNTGLALMAAQATGHSITGEGDAWIILNANGQVTATTDLSSVLSEKVNFATSNHKSTALKSVEVLTGTTLKVDASKIGGLEEVTGAGAVVVSAASATNLYDFSGLNATTATVQYEGGTFNTSTNLGTVRVEITTGTLVISAADASQLQLLGAGDFNITASSGAQVINLGGTGTNTINAGAKNDTINLTTTHGTQTVVIDSVFNSNDINTINATGIGATYVVNASVGNQINAAASTQNITINGSDSVDTITGGKGNDKIFGGGDDDTIFLSEGGTDTLVFSSTASDNGSDSIYGFTGGTSEVKDVLDFSRFLADRTFLDHVFNSQSEDDTVITNQIVMFNTDTSGLNVAGLVAEIEGAGNAFELEGKAIVITGNEGGAGDAALVYFVDMSLDSNVNDVTSDDVLLVGTLNSFDLDTLSANNFMV